MGFLGARVSATAAMLSAMTGLSLVDLPRQVEHTAGRSLGRLVSERGRPALVAAEREILARTLRLPSPAVIALGHATLEDPRCAELIRRGAWTVYLQRELLELYGQILDDIDAGRCRSWLFWRSRPTGTEELRPHLERARASYARADWTLEASGLAPAALVSRILAALPAAG